MPRAAAVLLLLAPLALGCGARTDLERGDAPSAATCPPDPCAVSRDLDEDGFDAVECGGADCNDDHAAVFPGASAPPRGWSVEPIEGAPPTFRPRLAVAAGVLYVLSNEGDDPGTCLNAMVTYERDPQGTWTRAVLDERVGSGGAHAIAAGPGPRELHLAYANGIACDGSGFGTGAYLLAASGVRGDLALDRLEEDPESALAGTSVAVDAVGRAWLAYTHAVSTTLRVGARGPAGWELEDVATDARWTTPASIAADCAPRVAYVTEARTLRELRRQGSTWLSSDLGPTDGAPSLVIDDRGASHILFAREGRVVHAFEDLGGWDEEFVLDGDRPRAALGPDGSLHVVFDQARVPRLATRRRGVWAIDDIPTARRDSRPSLAVDAAGTVHLVFVGSQGPVHVARVEDDLACPG